MRATQLASAEAVHAHSGVVVRITCRLPPEALMADSEAVSVSPHLLMADGPVEVTEVDPHAARSTVHAATDRSCRDGRVNRHPVSSRAMGG